MYLCKMNEFDWIIEAPMYIHLEPYTVYYFVEGGKTVDDIIERINPSQMLGNKESLVEWLKWTNEGEHSINYFALDDKMDIESWCDETPVSECREFYCPEPKFTYKKIDDFF